MLFCDLVGFTPLSESRDPEEVRELLSSYFETARTIVGRYGGVVEKFIGDAVMAVWGTPTATEEDPERAVRAALDVVQAVRLLGAELGVDLAARAGVVTGEVAVTVGASNEGMVAGDAVNTSARVQSAAAAGEVLVDDATHARTALAVAFADGGEHRLKGKSEPQRLWRAVRIQAGVGGSQRVDGLETTMVGRDAELSTVRELFHASAERRTPRLVLITGLAGTGKSRLGWEFEKYVDGLAQTVWWHRGRCLSYGDGVAYWALAEMVRQRLGIAEDDLPAAAAGKLDEGLLAFVPDAAQRGYIGLRLARLLGLPFPGDPGAVLSRDELFAGWRLFMERLAATAPLVLLVEDAHHADSNLLDFLDHLIDWSRELPIYVLVFARPELGQSRPGFGVGRNRTSLTVDPLDAAAMHELVGALVPDIPAAARAMITDRAEGVPLFAVEMIRALIDRDVVVPSEGVYRLAGDIGELAVPDSLHGLLAARLDALGPASRQLVADAAVLGSSFPADALVAVSDLPEPAARAELSELVRREILVVSADPLSPERGSYRFGQEMLRQVAYETMSRRDRKARHLTVAAHLRATFSNDGEEVIDVVARHYEDAMTAVPDAADVDQISGWAIEAYARAGDRAERTGAPARAAANFTAAAELSGSVAAQPDPRRTAELWHRAADAHRLGGTWPEGLELADRARDLFQALGDSRAAALAEIVAGRTTYYQGRLTESRARFTRATEALRDRPDAHLVFAMTELGGIATFSSDPDADELTSRAVTLAQRLGVDKALMSRALSIRGVCLDFNGSRIEGAMYVREAARLAEQGGDATMWGNALVNLSDMLGAEDPRAAADAAAQAAELLRRTGGRQELAVAVLNWASALISLGEWAAAGQMVATAVEEDDLADSDIVATARLWLLALRGDLAGAELLSDVLERLRATEDSQSLASVAQIDGLLATADERHHDALQAAQVSLGYAEMIGISSGDVRWAWPMAVRSAFAVGDIDTVRELVVFLESQSPGRLAALQRAELTLVRARLSVLDNDPGAAALFENALTQLAAISTPYHLAHGLLDHAAYLMTVGEPDEAERRVERAREIAERLGCRPLLTRIDGLPHPRPVPAI